MVYVIGFCGVFDGIEFEGEKRVVFVVEVVLFVRNGD